MEIRGVDGQTGPAAIGQARVNRTTPTPAAQANQQADSVQFSPMAQALEMYRQMPEVRADRVAAARAAIASGTLDTPEHLAVAADRLLEDLLSG
ncbi:MAG: hypothetical protein BIFFINMI_03870 [Phycisphaerae bacterium]|nr:hypothetical protein [Phycisphaerae bacterium]